jgi:predicted dehydrogenase
MKKAVVLIGTSMRAVAWVKHLLAHAADDYYLAGVMDRSPGKIRGFCEYLGLDIPVFNDFEAMVNALSPDLAIITTIDGTHADYVVAALDRKIAVMVEKPLCINPDQCRSILAAKQRNPEVPAHTAHNARYSPRSVKLKELLDKQVIGKIRSFHYEELLDWRHGTSYFRRWNCHRAESGGLQIHKSSHHFDLLNWLFESRASEVTASGALIAYGGKRRTRCQQCELDCPQRFIPDPATEQIWFKYTDGESYTPDLCIWSPDIDIEDVFSAGIRFANGIFGSYHLCAHANYEGERIQIEGDAGRIEYESKLLLRHGGSVHDDQVERVQSLDLHYFGKEPVKVEIPKATGSHGGADNSIFAALFNGKNSDQLATLEDGVQAVLTGCAVTESIKRGEKIDVQSLL